jgi:hypothetical protein
VPSPQRDPNARDASITKGLGLRDDGRIAIGPRAGIVHMVLSRELLRRALLIAQAICAESERRGWGDRWLRRLRLWQSRRGRVVVRGHAYPLEFQELTETLPFTEEEVLGVARAA